MNQIEIGKLIAKARQEKGYTQKQLADLLFVSDKAVSKWERGLSLPDVSIIIFLADFLELDVEEFLLKKYTLKHDDWSAYIISENLDKTIAGKPLLDYLVSYPMLLGIRNIGFKTTKKDFVNKRDLNKYGLHVSFGCPANKKVFLIKGDYLLYGNNLTRNLLTSMLNDWDVILNVSGREFPFYFLKNYPIFSADNIKRKKVGRGIVCLPLNLECEQFINIVERNTKMKIADLGEIATLRELNR